MKPGRKCIGLAPMTLAELSKRRMTNLVESERMLQMCANKMEIPDIETIAKAMAGKDAEKRVFRGEPIVMPQNTFGVPSAVFPLWECYQEEAARVFELLEALNHDPEDDIPLPVKIFHPWDLYDVLRSFCECCDNAFTDDNLGAGVMWCRFRETCRASMTGEKALEVPSCHKFKTP